MRKNFIAYSLLLALLVVPTAVQAQEDTSTTKPRSVQERLENARENMEKRQQEAVERRQEIKENIEENVEFRRERRADFAQFHAERISKLFEIYTTRLENLIEKTNSRLDKLAEDGIDIAEAKVKVEEAKNKLENGKNLGQQAVDLLKSIEPEEFEAQRETAVQARELIQEARLEFIDVVLLLQEAVQLAIDAREASL